ncbi:MAG: uncharacterized protein JWM74_6332, partial [Myxococcaceae bacterium]|nr:uncharacterized protein [Myxococcaceae bacterium]
MKALDVRLSRRRVPGPAIVTLLLALSATLSALGSWGGVTSFFALLLALTLWTVAGVGLGRFLRSLNPWVGAPRSATLSVDAGGVHLDGKVAMARRDVTRGFVVPKPLRPLVRIEGKGGRELEVEVPDALAAAELLRELALDGDHAAVKLRVFAALGSVAVRTTAIIASALVVVGLAIYGMTIKHYEYGFLLLLAQAAPYVLGQIEATLVIGKDGVHAARLLGGRFLSYDAFDSVERTSLAKKTAAGNFLSVRLKATGERVRLDEHLGIKWPDA